VLTRGLVSIAYQALNIASNKGGERASGNGNLFLGTLVGLELLTVKYWVNGRIYTVSVPPDQPPVGIPTATITTGTDTFVSYAVPATLFGSRPGLGLYWQKRVARYPAQTCQCAIEGLDVVL
jgi:hypothetical protein